MTPTVEKLLEEMAPVLERLIVTQVERVVRQTLAGIMPRDGRDGLPGTPGAQGERGADGRPGVDGRDGRDGTLDGVIFTREDRAVIVTRADGTEIGRWYSPEIIDRGHYRAGDSYDPGDAVTYAGSLWIAQNVTAAKPAEESAGWRLAVKRGDKGATGARGERGPAGEKGSQGLPGGRY